MPPFLLPLLTTALSTGVQVASGQRARGQAERQRKLAAETQRYSPWTGLQAQAVQEGPGEVESLFGGLMSGLAASQALQKGGGLAGIFGGGTEAPVAKTGMNLPGLGGGFQSKYLGNITEPAPKLPSFDMDALQVPMLGASLYPQRRRY